jgi:hypothetical protein
MYMYPQGTQEQTVMPIIFLLQLWDIREGSCKQTFPGHESDINAVTVSLACMLAWEYNIKNDHRQVGCEISVALYWLMLGSCGLL